MADRAESVAVQLDAAKLTLPEARDRRITPRHGRLVDPQRFCRSGIVSLLMRADTVSSDAQTNTYRHRVDLLLDLPMCLKAVRAVVFGSP